MQYSIGDLIENKYLVLASYPKLVLHEELYVVYDFKTKQKCEYWKNINYTWKCYYWANKYYYLEIAKFLFENGANTNSRLNNVFDDLNQELFYP